MARKFVLIAGLCAGLVLSWNVSGARAEGNAAIASDDAAVLNSALEELGGVLRELQSDLDSEETAKKIDIAAVHAILSQISLNLDMVSIALSGGEAVGARKFAASESLEVSVGQEGAVIPLADTNAKAGALTIENLMRHKSATFTFVAMLLVFGIILFLRKGPEESDESSLA